MDAATMATSVTRIDKMTDEQFESYLTTKYGPTSYGLKISQAENTTMKAKLKLQPVPTTQSPEIATQAAETANLKPPEPAKPAPPVVDLTGVDLDAYGLRLAGRRVDCRPARDRQGFLELPARCPDPQGLLQGEQIVMMTSYYGNLKQIPPGMVPVAISVGIPAWYKGRREERLAPTRPMLKMSRREYDPQFRAILERLDPRELYESLGANAVLLCWEKPNLWCHRRLVAEWLEQALSIEVPELGLKRCEVLAYHELPAATK